MRRGLLTILTMALMLTTLTACGIDNSTIDGETSGLTAAIIKLPDGRHVTCITSSQTARSGVSCDWGHAK